MEEHQSSIDEVLDQCDSRLVLDELVSKQFRPGVKLRPVEGQ